jgi:hypothetical protein
MVIVDSKTESEILLLKKILGIIKREKGYFSNFFYSKDLPWLGHFVEPF